MCQKTGNEVTSIARQWIMFCLRKTLLLAGTLLGAAAMAQMDPQRDFIVAGKDVFMMLPQEFICGPRINQMTWSPDGDKLALIREFADMTPSMAADMLVNKEADTTLDPEYQIITWSAVTRKTTVLYKLKLSQGVISAVQWLAGSSSLLVDASLFDNGEGSGPIDRRDLASVPRTVFLISPNGKPTTVFRSSNPRDFWLNPSPFKPIVALTEYAPPPPPVPKGEPAMPRDPATIRFFGASGVLSQPIKMPGSTSIPFWSSNGTFYAMTVTRKADAKGARRDWFAIDRDNQKWISCQPPADADAMFRQLEPREIAVQNLTPSLEGTKLGIRAPTVILSAKDAQSNEVSVVSTDAVNGELSPKLNGVSYQSQGSLMVRPMVKVPLEAYLKAKEAALKAKLVSNAKQVALAMLMYANDNNDTYLSKDSSLTNALGPYLKNNSLLDGFNYVLGGGNLNDIEQPATTVLGYFDGPGGRAVAYCDGHVKWVTNP